MLFRPFWHYPVVFIFTIIIILCVLMCVHIMWYMYVFVCTHIYVWV